MDPFAGLIPLSRLEAELGISRVDLLLLIRRLGLEPIRRGMRTFLNTDDAASLVNRAAADPGEMVAAELVAETPPRQQLPVPVDGNWQKASLYADLRLFRERLEILECLMRTGIEVENRELADLLQLKRLPPVVSDAANPYFDRLGLRFWRINRTGQRLSWKVSNDHAAQQQPPATYERTEDPANPPLGDTGTGGGQTG